jgi:hypothetical protein
MGFNGNFSTFHIQGAAIVDPLHILKRFRYRLLKTTLHNGFSVQDPIVNFSCYIKELNIPTVVFDDSGFTKMNDALPLHLFTLNNLFSFYENSDIPMLAYNLIPTLTVSIFQDNSLSINIRCYLLKVIYYFMTFYSMKLLTENNILKEKRTKNNCNVRLFTKALTIILSIVVFSFLI